MFFTRKQKVKFDEYIHKGGRVDGRELWNRHDLHIIIDRVLKEAAQQKMHPTMKAGASKSDNESNPAASGG